MVVAIEVQLGRAQEGSAWEVVLRVPFFSFGGVSLPCFPCFLLLCLVPALSDEAGAGAGAGAGG